MLELILLTTCQEVDDIGNGTTSLMDAAIPQYTGYMLNIMFYLQIIRQLLLPVFGITGSIISIIVLTKSPLKTWAICSYLISMAVADTITLSPGILVFFSNYFDLWNSTAWSCKLQVFIRKVSSFTSDITVCAVAVNRALVVSLPLMAKLISTRRRNLLAVLGIIFLAICLSVHTLWTWGIGQGKCMIQYYPNLNEIFSIISLSQKVIGAVIISICSIIILVKLSQHHQIMDGFQGMPMEDITSMRAVQTRETQIGIMFTAIALFFLITNLPILILFVSEAFFSWRKYSLYHQVSKLIYYIF